MKTNKKAISLIVLVITIIVLSILAATVILNLSNTNIMEQANKTSFKADMAKYKQTVQLYVASEMAEDKTGDTSGINLVPGDEGYGDVFGEVPDKYAGKLSIVAGELVYATTDQTEIDVLDELGISSGANLVDYSKNLLDPSQLVAGSFNASGAEITSTNFARSGYIPVQAGESVTYQFTATNPNGSTTTTLTGMRWVVAYNEDKEIIDIQEYVSGQYSYIIPDECKYIRIAVTATTTPIEKQPMLHYGTEVQPYEPYGRESLYDFDLITYGDSLTFGTGGSVTTYGKVLADELGLAKYVNYGYGGCNSKFIAWAAGGIDGYLEPNKSVDVQIVDDSLSDVISDSANLVLNGKEVLIDGNKYTVTQTQKGYYTINDYSPSSTYIPVELPTAQYDSSLYVIWMGTNDLGLETEYIDAVIDKINSNNYIVMGLTRLGTDTTEEQEAEALEKFGEHWFNTRQEIISNGLDIIGLEPTDEDITAMGQGLMPPSLLSDGVHFNEDGYTCIGKLLAQKIRNNGYCQ